MIAKCKHTDGAGDAWISRSGIGSTRSGSGQLQAAGEPAVQLQGVPRAVELALLCSQSISIMSE